MAHVIAVLNSKGSSGKTTIVMNVNVVGCLHRRSHSFLVIESDPQGSVLDWAAASQRALNLLQ